MRPDFEPKKKKKMANLIVETFLVFMSVNIFVFPALKFLQTLSRIKKKFYQISNLYSFLLGEKLCWVKFLIVNIVNSKLPEQNSTIHYAICYMIAKMWLLERPTLASRVPLFLLGHFPTNECEISDFLL